MANVEIKMRYLSRCVNVHKRLLEDIPSARLSVRSCQGYAICPTSYANLQHVNEATTSFSKTSYVQGQLQMSMTGISTTENDHTKNKQVTKPSTQMSGEFQLRHADTNKSSKTVVLLFDFYKASEKAIASYCSLYHGYGFDVLYAKSHLKHFAWPRNSETLASKLLQHIQTECSSYENILVHAASIGAYNFSVIMAEMYEKLDLHANVRKKIKAVVYDSLTIGSLENMAKGVAHGTRNVLLQKLVPLLMHSYFYITWSQTVALYDHYISVFKQRPLEVPTLLFSCRNDPMSDYHAVEDLVELWKSHFKFPLTHRCWEKSRHAAHLRIHREEYVRDLDTFCLACLVLL